METSVTTPHYPNSSVPFSASFFAGKHHSATTSSSFISFSFKSPPPPTPPGSGSSSNSSPPSGKLRRPKTLKNPPSSKPTPKTPSSNPLKGLLTSNNGAKDVDSVTNKLWLTSKLSPPPPPPPPPPLSSPPEKVEEIENEVKENEGEENLGPPRIEFRQEGKIFVGNLPSWVKKNEVAEFFRQFGPIKNVILIKGHDSTQRNAGFGFVLYGGSTATKSAMKAVEFDGVELHGRVLTVKLDDGKRSKEKTEERARWVQGYDGGGLDDYPSKWHEERTPHERTSRRFWRPSPRTGSLL